MRRIFMVGLLAISSVIVFACSGDDDGSQNGTGGGGDNNTGRCCPPDPAPACCMDYGGWSAAGSCGVVACDGMPLPNDPGWQKVKDDHGCDKWVNAQGIGSTKVPICGTALEAGPDTSQPPPPPKDSGGSDTSVVDSSSGMDSSSGQDSSVADTGGGG